MEEALQREFDGARKNGVPLSVIVLDVDHFKHYNDSHGHLKGDQLLQLLAELLRQGVREGDIVVRWGGEEFVVICPNCPPTTAYELGRRLCRAVAVHPFLGREAQPMGYVSVSVGVAAMTSQTPDPSELIHRADAAAYEVKQNGHNGVRLMS